MKILNEDQCFKRISKYWQEHYKAHDDVAEFGIDIDTATTHSWNITLHKRHFLIQINKLSGEITEINR